MLRIYGNCALGPFVSPEAFTQRFSDHLTESASNGKSPEVEHEEPIEACNVEGLDVCSRGSVCTWGGDHQKNPFDTTAFNSLSTMKSKIPL
jgi:hypothetical protein